MAGTLEQGAEAKETASERSTRIIRELLQDPAAVKELNAAANLPSNSDAQLRNQQNAAEGIRNISKKSPTKKPPITKPAIAKNVDTDTSTNIIPGLKPNVLSSVDNVGYNLRLYMASEKTTHETLPFDTTVIIAETGSTGFNIIDLQLDTIISPSQITKNTFATSVVVKIIEPFGTSLLDHMRNVALRLKIKDARRVPVWLDIRFKGYKQGFDNSYEGGEFADLSGETRTWRMRVKNIDVEMGKGGTEYTMHLIPQDERALENSARLLKKQIILRAILLGLRYLVHLYSKMAMF